MAYQSFEDLEVWQRGCRLSVSIFQTFEGCKNFTLKDQIGRPSLSIPCNIAEGSERGSTKDLAHFLNFSKGSCGELPTQLYIARKLGYAIVEVPVVWRNSAPTKVNPVSSSFDMLRHVIRIRFRG